MQFIRIILCLPAFLVLTASRPRPLPGPSRGRVITGAERMADYLPLMEGKRVALLINPTSMVGPRDLLDTLLSLHVRVVKIFSPEHGFRGQADAGATVGNSVDSQTGIQVISLYGRHTTPSAADLADVDVMVYDIQDVGARFYTYISSLQRYMEAASRYQKLLILLDRPDPNGSVLDGPVLDTAFRSFVGLQPVPLAYGMTIGEYALMLNGEHWLSSGLQCNLKVIPCLLYTHQTRYELPVRPSPNLPDMAAVYLYPSLCLFEGTSVSVGRGTPLPFQVFGEPDFPHQLYHFIPESLPGATAPPYAMDTCYGYDLSGIASGIYNRLGGRISLRWLIRAYALCPDKAHFFHAYFNKLAGTDKLADQIRAGWSPERIRESWQPGLNRFRLIRKKYLLYP